MFQNGAKIYRFIKYGPKHYCKLMVWMISVVKMELYSNTEKADYDSYWGSYTFSYN
jgi:hypothetical protein